MNKKADGGPVMWIIIAAALALLVFIILALGGGKTFAQFFSGIYKDCIKEGNVCKSVCGVGETEISYMSCKNKLTCCQPIPSGGGLGLGESCTDNSECASNYCKDNVCAEKPGGGTGYVQGNSISLLEEDGSSASTITAEIDKSLTYYIYVKDNAAITKCIAYIWRVDGNGGYLTKSTDGKTGTDYYRALFDCRGKTIKLDDVLHYKAIQKHLELGRLELRVRALKCTTLACATNPTNWLDDMEYPIELKGDTTPPTPIIDDSNIVDYYEIWANMPRNLYGEGVKLACKDDQSGCSGTMWYISSSIDCPTSKDDYLHYGKQVTGTEIWVKPEVSVMYGSTPTPKYLCLYVEDKAGNKNTAKSSKPLKIGNNYAQINCGQGKDLDICGAKGRTDNVLLWSTRGLVCCFNSPDYPPQIFADPDTCKKSQCGKAWGLS